MSMSLYILLNRLNILYKLADYNIKKKNNNYRMTSVSDRGVFSMIVLDVCGPFADLELVCQLFWRSHYFEG